MENRVEQKVGDARGLPAGALERLRRQVVEAVEAGTPQMQAAFLFGVSRRSVGEWVRAYRVKGEESFRPGRRGRRPGEQYALTGAQQERILRVLVAGPPDRVALPWRLWTRSAVAALIRREFGIRLRSATVGRYLQRWGVDAIAEACVAVPEQAVAATLPVEELRVAWTRPSPGPGREPGHALLAVTGRGVLHFLAGEGPFDHAALDDFRDRLRAQLTRDVRIVVCSWPPERLALLGEWLSGAPRALTPGART